MNRGPLDMKDIECPVCLELMQPPIYQCENRHGMCNKCQPQLTDCPLCKGKLTDERKHDAEMLSLSIKHHCKYQTSGCTQLYFLADMDKHEEQCLYRHRECPLGEIFCSEEVNPTVAKDHILENHADLVTHRPLNISKGLRLPSQVNRVLVKGVDIFVVNVEFRKVDGTWNMIVSCTYVGSPDDAGKYKYMLTLYGQRSYGMLSYTKPCLSYLELFERGKTANTCIVLPNAVYKEFCGGICSLTYEVEVGKI